MRRLRASLTDMAAVFGDREAAVARELTKLYETCIRGPLDVLAADPRFESPKGEIVILVGPGSEKPVQAGDAESALREAMWAMVSDIHLKIPDADYKAHARDYLNRFEELMAH